MAEGDTGKDQPSLELPKLRLRRRKRPDAAPPEEAAVAPAPEPEPEPEPAETAVLEPVPPPATQARPKRPERPVRPERAERTAEEPAQPRERRAGGMPAAVLTGVAVGLLMVGLTWAGLRGCEAVQGTSSCGGAGYPLLAAILVVMVLVGAALLRATRVADPVSTSILAVGLTAVLAMLFLVDSLQDLAMVVVIPLISAGSYAVSHWVTSTFVEPGDR